MSKLSFKTPGASNPSFHTRTVSADHNYTKSFIKTVGWECNDFFFGETKRRLHDRKTDYFKTFSKGNHSSANAYHVKTTGHNIKWGHFDILVSGKTDYHCKVKETLFIQELQPVLKVNVSSERLLLYKDSVSILCDFTDSFRLKRLKLLLQIFLSRFQTPIHGVAFQNFFNGCTFENVRWLA